MRKPMLMLCMLALLAPALGLAEEFSLKDGTRISGKLVRVQGDSLEVETQYGKIRIARDQILSITFPENQPPDQAGQTETPEPRTVQQALVGTSYTNQTGKFKLTLPAGWRIQEQVRRAADTLAALSSLDETLIVLVDHELFGGSLRAYTEILENGQQMNLSQYQKLTQEEVRIDGVESSLKVFLARAENGAPLKYIQAVVPLETGMALVTGFTPEPLFEEVRETFRSILLSYETLSE